MLMSATRLFRSFFQTAAHQEPDVLGHTVWQGIPMGLAADDGGNRVGHVLARKRARARQHLVEHASERPDVTALVGRLPFGLFRAHVRCRAENHPGLRHRSFLDPGAGWFRTK
jgi:hypothetical protein